MDYGIIEENNRIIMTNGRDFEPKHIFECGQAFRWYLEDDNSYTIIFRDKVINVKKENGSIILTNTNMEDFKKIWYDYFDLDRDYGEIKEELSKDPVLKEAIAFGQGIRVLNQDPFETTISFIISANNFIPRIKKSIELIAKEYGQRLPIDDEKREYYSFPTCQQLAEGREDILEEKCKVGYRAKYIVKTSQMIRDKAVDPNELYRLSMEEAKEILMKLPGVGPKVSNCILLFSLKKNQAFPVDVWIKRVMEELYFEEGASIGKISNFAKENFGSLGGFAQQYLFYYARELGIGRKKQ